MVIPLLANQDLTIPRATGMHPWGSAPPKRLKTLHLLRWSNISQVGKAVTVLLWQFQIQQYMQVEICILLRPEQAEGVGSLG